MSSNRAVWPRASFAMSLVMAGLSIGGWDGSNGLTPCNIASIAAALETESDRRTAMLHGPGGLRARIDPYAGETRKRAMEEAERQAERDRRAGLLRGRYGEDAPLYAEYPELASTQQIAAPRTFPTSDNVPPRKPPKIAPPGAYSSAPGIGATTTSITTTSV